MVIGRRTCNREVAGSSPGRSTSRTTMGKLFTYTCLCSPSSINWYRRKLGAKQAFHASSVSVELQLLLWCLAEGYRNGDQRRALWALVALERLLALAFLKL